MKKYVSFLFTLGFLALSDSVIAQGTAFTYQGRLQNNGSPANGNYDFTFALFNNNSTNTGRVGATLTNLDVGVTNGLFIVTLDFGGNFPGASRWLSVGVRTNGGTGFTALNPLQEVTPAPYAIYAPNAGNAVSATSANSVAAVDISGTLLPTQLPAVVVTNAGTGVTLGGTFSGNGAGLTNVSASQLAGGSNQNVFVGPAGNAGAAGADNTAVGSGAFYGYSGSTGSDNTALGAGTLFNNGSGSFNTAVGQNALNNVYSGSNNTAVGYEALYVNLFGVNNTAVGSGALENLGVNSFYGLAGGSNNIALGLGAGSAFVGNESSNIDIGSPGISGENNTMRLGTPGVQINTFIAGIINGNGARLTNVSASQLAGGSNQNIFVGPAGNAGATGADNTAVGSGAFYGYSGSTGSDNTALGAGTLFNNGSGSFNTAVGQNALNNVYSGSNNTAVGYEALYVNLFGVNNTAVGSGALENLGVNSFYGLAGGSNNIALGLGAGSAFVGNESSNIDIGSPGISGENNTMRLGTPGVQINTFIAGIINGNGAGLTNLNASQLTSIANPNGADNFFVGNAGNASSLGEFNTAMGNVALAAVTSGGNNTAIGDNTLASNLTGNQNTAYGSGSLQKNTNGGGNTATGFQALRAAPSGSQNTATGNNALGQLGLNNNVGGSNNIAFGYQAGFNFVNNESSNIVIGNLGVAGDNNTIRIGTNQTATHIAGIFGATAASGVEVFVNSSGQLGTATSSARFKKDIQSMDDASDVLLSLHPVKFKYKPELDPQGLPQFGLVAEEVDKVDPDLVARDGQGRINTVRYNAVNAMLLNEFLKQHRKVQQQSAEIEKLKAKADKVDVLEKQLYELKQAVQWLAEKK